MCCRDTVRSTAAIESRSRPATSKRSASAAVFMRSRRRAMSSLSLPSRKSTTSSTESAYACGDTGKAHGPGQRWIWYCRHTRPRCSSTWSVHVRSWKWRLSTRRVSRHDVAEWYGPK